MDIRKKQNFVVGVLGIAEGIRFILYFLSGFGLFQDFLYNVSVLMIVIQGGTIALAVFWLIQANMRDKRK